MARVGDLKAVGSWSDSCRCVQHLVGRPSASMDLPRRLLLTLSLLLISRISAPMQLWGNTSARVIAAMKLWALGAVVS